jgi:hypothetical protein
MSSDLFEYGLSQSSNHLLQLTLDPRALNCSLHPSLFGIFCIKPYVFFFVFTDLV